MLMAKTSCNNFHKGLNFCVSESILDLSRFIKFEFSRKHPTLEFFAVFGRLLAVFDRLACLRSDPSVETWAIWSKMQLLVLCRLLNSTFDRLRKVLIYLILSVENSSSSLC